MRECHGKQPKKPAKEEKVIRRELACVLTSGTLVDGGMLQDDMSPYCVSIKESVMDELSAFGVAFVDTATRQFSLVQFIDDVDLTKFESFVAQIRPQELLLEKSNLSVKAMRILKTNTRLATIWNHLKPGKEYCPCSEIDASDYLSPTTVKIPKYNLQSSQKLEYPRSLKIERELLTLANFTWYHPIRKASVDAGRINARLDAINSLNADVTVRDRFTSQLTRMPDLE
ncbi:MAG: hypothetical protein Q9187_002905 [Circinaria calcarea]